MSGRAADVPFQDRASALDYLKSLAPLGDATWPIAEAALALASLDRPQVGLARYREHLEVLASDVGAAAVGAETVADRVAALQAVTPGAYGYRGDDLTYDDLQNANLMRVIDRRKGLPVALGILYLHAGRAQGWEMTGLAFPGHFLLRLEGRGGPCILDPFHEGSVKGAAELRTLLKSVAGADQELSATHYAQVPDREVLLRLQNNIKLRLLDAGRREAALALIDSMLAIASDRAEFWCEQGAVNASLGNLGAAIRSLEAALERERDSTRRFATAALLQELKTRLQ
ncbi:MAG TPA: transglutaminase-like domain-containing protein [Stellaceae bacterium]|nr:transglutaminase-like domain-containing protein [Stellaceae bacterium]